MQYNFIHKFSDYQLSLELRNGAENSQPLFRHTSHSFALKRTLIVEQNAGGSVTTQHFFEDEGKVYLSEFINVTWINKNSFPDMSSEEFLERIEMLKGMENCFLFQTLAIESPEQDIFDILMEDQTQIMFFQRNIGWNFTFSVMNGDLLFWNGIRVLNYLEKPLLPSLFQLPPICLKIQEQINDFRLEKPTKSITDNVPYVDSKRKLQDAHLWLEGRRPGTKWCGKGNDYNNCGSIQASPTIGSVVSCKDAPIIGSNCPVQIIASPRISGDVFDFPVPPSAGAFQPNPNCSPGPWCVADEGDKRLTEMDKACRQHDLCPFASGHLRSCWCDKNLRDRVHKIALEFGDSPDTDLVKFLFSNNNPFWPCYNLRRTCSRTNFIGFCNHYDQWHWETEIVHKYEPPFCPPDKTFCLTKFDEDGRLWGQVGYDTQEMCILNSSNVSS